MSDLSIVLGAYPRIHFACRAREVRDVASGIGLTEHQVRTLGHLGAEDPTMVTELAEYMGVTPSTMSLNLKRLEAGGFIVRSRDPEDRRVVNVLLTERGRQIRDSATLLDPDRVDAMLSGLRPDERRRALDGLTVLAEAADRLVARKKEYVASLTDSRSLVQ
ncbi:MAG: MarR family winged helix-turn-helix transcriptional regulator [Gemmatimonadetes bacterium]|nr:MarR family winged helix-turn-helix transcriptional regulator [Gemmatimonadota bacterium]